MNTYYRLVPTLAVAACALTSTAFAQNTYINNFGVGGWYSDDTRSNSGANLVGESSTHGASGTADDDLAISSFLSFTSNFAGSASSSYGLGALRIWSGTENAAKSTLSIINTTDGFASSSELLSSDFYASYRAYNEPSPTSRSVAFRFGIQSTAWEASQDGFTATRTGENSWDMILVYIGSNTPNDWTQHSLSATEGNWALYFQADNSHFGTRPTDQKTLAEWALDETYGSLLFGEGALISNVQFGLGSSARNNSTYIDYLQSNLLNNGRAINFVDSSVQVTTATPTSGANDLTASENTIVQLGSGEAADAQFSIGNTGTDGEKTVVEVTPGAEIVIQSLAVAEGGVLAGGGRIEASDGITISGGGIHAPGFSPGVQVLASDYTNTAALEIEIGGLQEAAGTELTHTNGDFDQLLILGNVDLSGLTLTIKAYNGFTPEVGDTFNILYFTDETPDLDNLTVLIDGFAYPVTFELNTILASDGDFLDQTGLNYLQLEVMAIPEPGTFAMLLAGGAVGYTLMRRRRLVG